MPPGQSIQRTLLGNTGRLTTGPLKKGTSKYFGFTTAYGHLELEIPISYLVMISQNTIKYLEELHKNKDYETFFRTKDFVIKDIVRIYK